MEYSSFDKLNNTQYYNNTNNNYINRNNNSDSDFEFFKSKKQIKYEEYIIYSNNDYIRKQNIIILENNKNRFPILIRFIGPKVFKYYSYFGGNKSQLFYYH